MQRSTRGAISAYSCGYSSSCWLEPDFMTACCISSCKQLGSMYLGSWLFNMPRRLHYIVPHQSSTWAMWFVITPPVPSQPIWPCTRNQAYTLALASKIDFTRILEDAEQPTYICLRCVAFVSWAYWNVRWALSLNLYGHGLWHVVTILSGLVCAWHPHSSCFVIGFKNSSMQPL